MAAQQASASQRANAISFWEKIGYGCGDLASNLAFQVIINFLQAYYTDTLLLDPARVALIFGLVRLSDAITDPLMGGLADRTQTKWGQFRPWLLWLAIPFGVAYVLAFSIGGIEGEAKAWAAFATYFILMAAYTAINIPYGAMATAITPDPDERMSLRSWQFAMAQTGNIIVGAATMPLVGVLGAGDNVKGFQLVIAIYSSLAVALFFLCFLTTRERISASGQVAEKGSKQNNDTKRTVSVWQDIGSLFRNDQWIVLASINFFLLMAVVMRGANTFYFTKYVLVAEDMFSVYLTLAAIAAVLGSVVAGRFSGGFAKKDVYLSIGIGVSVLALITVLGLSNLIVKLPLVATVIAICAMIVGGAIAHELGRRFNRVNAFVGLFIAQAIAQFMVGFASDNLPLAALFMFVLSAFTGQVAVPVLWAMLSDCVDYGQHKTGIRNNGLVFSSVLFSLKLGVTAGGVIGGMILAWTGYAPDQEQSRLALSGILFAFAYAPGIAFLIVAAISLRLKLTEAYTRQIQTDISGRAEAVR